MKTLVYEGGGGFARTYVRGGQVVTFEIGKATEVEDDFAQELLNQNPSGMKVSEAEVYGIPVFKLSTKGKGGSPEAASEGVGS